MFDAPHYLLLFWLLPFLAFLLFYAYRQKRRAAALFLDEAMQKRLMPQAGAWRVFCRGVLLFSALALLFIAAACPLFGTYIENVSRNGADIFILLDVSRSMLAEDVPPNRLTRAKLDIKDLLARTAGERVGLIVFAGKPLVKVPLTTDQGFFNEILDAVEVNSAPRGGTAVGDAIRKALSVMPPEQDRDRAVVLITDGEDHESMPLEAAQQAAADNVKILSVGLGDTVEGARIPQRDENGNLTYQKLDGVEIWSKVNEDILKEIARITGGVYVPVKTKVFDLGQIYTEHLANLRGNDDQTEQRKKVQLQYQPFLTLAVVLLMGYVYVKP